MNSERISAGDLRIQSALVELENIIQRHYPAATFEVFQGEDPEGIYLTAIVDLEDTTALMDVIIDRLLEMQVEQELPVYVVPIRPLQRVMQEMQTTSRLMSS